MNTWERIAAIEAAIADKIKAATLNVEISGVVVGSKSKLSDFNPPFVWLLPLSSRIDDTSLALNETWYLKKAIIGVVQSYDPANGRAQAEELALRASAELIKTPQARQLDGNANDTMRTGWTPASDRITNDGALYGAGVEIEVRFSTRNP